MSATVRFKQADVGRNEYVSENGCWLLEKAWVEGPRGGMSVVWHLYELVDGRLSPVASEKRLRDLWPHLEPVEEWQP